MVLGAGAVLVISILLLRTSSDSFVLLPDDPNRADTVVRVAGETRPKGDAGIYYLDVLIHQASLPEAWLARFEDGADVINRNAYIPKGVSTDQQHDADVVETTDSKVVASVVALRALGRKVEVSGRGVRVVDVLRSAPSYAAGLRHGMRIVTIDGTPVRSLSALHRVMKGAKPGATIRLGVTSGIGVRELTFPLTSNPSLPGRGTIGITANDVRPRVKLPVKVEITTGQLGGPSAGLAFALEIYDSLSGRAFASRGKVAVTGTIDFDGAVGPIGGMRQKAIGARDGGADVLIVPRQNYAEARDTLGRTFRIVPVDTFADALRALRST